MFADITNIPSLLTKKKNLYHIKSCKPLFLNKLNHVFFIENKEKKYNEIYLFIYLFIF
jgi:hypothetical protein